MINRNNYEEYFLLYADNELSGTVKTAVEEFVKANPDLRNDLITLLQLKLKPEQNIFFSDKDTLFRESSESSGINHNNYEEYFLLYADNELNADEKKKVEEFVSNNPAIRQEFELLLIAQVGPDINIVFPNKEILYRESKRRIVFLPWMRVAAAAVVFLLVGLFVFNNAEKTPSQPVVTTSDNKSGTNTTAENNKEIKKSQSAVTSASDDSLNLSNTTIEKLAVAKLVKKMNEKKNKNSEARKNQQPSNQDVALHTVDFSEQIITTAKIDKSVQKVNDKKTNEVAAPAITSNTANLVAFTSTNNIDTDGLPDSDDKGNLYIASTTTKKSKFRGFFRKVSRAFNKTAHVDNENSDAILIGSFRIALK